MRPAEIIAGVLAAGVFGAAAVAQLRRPRNPLLIAAAAAGPVAIPAGMLATTSAIVAGNPALAAASAAGTLLWRFGARPGGERHHATDGDQLQLLSANLLYLNRKPREAAQAIAAIEVDIIITVETAQDSLDALGEELTEHDLAGLGFGPRGEMVAVWVHRGIEYRTISVELPDGSQLPGILTPVNGIDTQIVGVHLYAPVNAECRDLWDAELVALRTWAEEQTTEVILAGDFNASLNHPGMRELAATLPDAARSLGRGMLRTWPARGFRHGRGRCIPIFGLDHVLISRGLAPASLETRLFPGADHLGLLAGIGRARTGRSVGRATPASTTPVPTTPVPTTSTRTAQP
jgi:endonuclease/exonuclease/phosphatase (EEP) superfamily protein YafD